MKTTDIYSKEELELFYTLEKAVEDDVYKPISKEKLDEKKVFLKNLLIILLKHQSKS